MNGRLSLYKKKKKKKKKGFNYAQARRQVSKLDQQTITQGKKDS